MYLSIDEVNAFLNTFEPIYEKLKKEKYNNDAIENIVSKNTKLKNKIIKLKNKNIQLKKQIATILNIDKSNEITLEINEKPHSSKMRNLCVKDPMYNNKNKIINYLYTSKDEEEEEHDEQDEE